MSRWYVDNAPVLSIPADDRAALYGDGLFETVAIRQGTARLWDYHVERLQLGCERLGIEPPDTAVLTSNLEHAIAAGDVDTNYAVAKLVIATRSGERGYRRADGPPLIRIGMFEATPRPAASYEQGVRVRLCATRLAIQPQLAGIKTLNRLEQVLARAEWRQPDIVEGLTLDTGARLICGTMSNVFVRLDNQLVTPAITRCGVAGVMRRHVLTSLDREGVAVDVRDVSVKELSDAQEIFLTNSQFGVLPVAQLDSRVIRVGKQTRQVMALIAKSGIGEYRT